DLSLFEHKAFGYKSLSTSIFCSKDPSITVPSSQCKVTGILLNPFFGGISPVRIKSAVTLNSASATRVFTLPVNSFVFIPQLIPLFSGTLPYWSNKLIYGIFFPLYREVHIVNSLCLQ